MCSVESQRLATVQAQRDAAEQSTVPPPPPIISAIVDDRALERLSQSRRVRDLLDDAELRAVLKRVMSEPATQREDFIQRAQLEDARFLKLTTEILDVVLGRITESRSCP
jgi:DNA-binding TFAR19-related protein (PDSD5 family)